jgi:nucleoside phosphorylase
LDDTQNFIQVSEKIREKHRVKLLGSSLIANGIKITLMHMKVCRSATARILLKELRIKKVLTNGECGSLTST